MSLALLDQMGSPLQALELSTGTLELAHTGDPNVATMRRAISEIKRVCARVPPPDARVYQHLAVSFDGTAELRLGAR